MRYKKTTPALTTILRLGKNFNNLKNVEKRNGQRRSLVFEEMVQIVNCCFPSPENEPFREQLQI